MKIHVYMGVMGSGKDYAAQEHINKGAVKVSFADALREDVWKILGWRPKNEQEYELFKKGEVACYSEVIDSEPGDLHKMSHLERLFKTTGREILQRYGTQVRRAEDPNIWAHRTVGKIIDLWNEGVDTVVITDCRFPNEVQAMKFPFMDNDDFEVTFHFCNYKSEKYTLDSEHDSEKLSIELVRLFHCGEFTIDTFHQYITENDWVGTIDLEDLEQPVFI